MSTRNRHLVGRFIDQVAVVLRAHGHAGVVRDVAATATALTAVAAASQRAIMTTRATVSGGLGARIRPSAVVARRCEARPIVVRLGVAEGLAVDPVAILD